VWTAVGLMGIISVAAVARRALHLLTTIRVGRAPATEAMDAVFVSHKGLTLAHIFAGLVFILLALIPFTKFRPASGSRMHLFLTNALFAVGTLVGVTAILMSLQTTIGGANETAATLFFGVLFLIALIFATVRARQQRYALEREWRIRSFAIALAIATVRPIVGIFFATSRISHLTPREFFGTAFWLGFTLHLIVAEWWIHATVPNTFETNLEDQS
jgi:uncharacterized membrane protein YsdA (DUF1294 family)